MNISIVIPTYNEKDTLPILIDKLTREVKKIAEKFSFGFCLQTRISNCLR
jgi:GT2 family glycosyltransferase